jgi:hypothetical protein
VTEPILAPELNQALLAIEMECHDNPREKIAGLRAEIDCMQRNLAGNFVRRFDIHTGNSVWRFGALNIPPLFGDDGKPLPDNPLLGETRDDIPVAEFMGYLNNWYHPTMRLRTLHPGGKRKTA